VNVRKEVTEKHNIDEWRKACEVQVSRHIDYAATKRAQTINNLEINNRQYSSLRLWLLSTFTVLT